MRRVALSNAAKKNLARYLTMNGTDSLLNPTDEHRQLREVVARFGREKVDPQARQADVDGEFNQSLFKELADLGVMGVTVPEEHGGVGMDATAACIVHHELSKYDPGFCLAYLAHSMLFVNNFYVSANEKQREKYLEAVISGEKLGAMGMSEPSAGTDVLGMQTNAVQKGDYFVLNGGKTWITNGTHADIYIVYAKVDGKITAFLVERGTEGFTNGPKIDKCGMRGSTMCELSFVDVKIPAENLLGEVGGGITCMMRNLELERLTLAAMSVGIADRCVDEMFQWSQQRKAFGKPISAFGQIQKYVAEAFTKTEAAKVFTYTVAQSVSPTTQNRIGTDAVKLFATPVGKEVADAAIQVLGGMGYSRDMPVERLWRDAKLLEVCNARGLCFSSWVSRGIRTRGRSHECAYKGLVMKSHFATFFRTCNKIKQIGGGTLESHHKNIMKDLAKLA